MKILILGGSGLLGHKLVQILGKKFDVRLTLRDNFAAYEHFNIFDRDKVFENVYAEDFESVSKIIRRSKPDVIINAIGVIKQKAEARDVVKTLEVNAIFPHKVARLAGELNARFISFSTDCVFDGNKGNYTEEDTPNATDLYGLSKYLGEVDDNQCLTLRTSIIGRELSTSRSLVEWFRSNQGGTVKGFSNAIYSGFPTIIVADVISDIIENHPHLSGIYHLASEPINKFDLLKLIKKKLDLNIVIEPFEDFKIDRSLDSGKLRKIVDFQTDSWEILVGKMLDDPTPYEKWRSFDRT